MCINKTKFDSKVNYDYSIVMWNTKNKLIVLFLGAAIFGLSISFIFRDKINSTAVFIDSMAYKATAVNIVEHWNFSDSGHPQPNNFRAPGYPMWLAIIYFIFGSFQYAVPAGILVFSFTAPLAYLIGREIFNERIAWISGILTAFEPWAAFLTGTLMSEQLFMPIFMLSIYFFIRYLKQNFPKYLYFSTGLLGAAALIRPNVLYFFPVILVFLIIKNRDAVSFRNIIFAVLIFSAIVFPWLLRNKIVLDTWQITSVQGFSLYGDKFNALQVYLGNFKSLDDGNARAYEITKGYVITSKEGSEILMKEAVAGIKANLPAYIKISIMSLPKFFISNSYSSLGYYWGMQDFKIQSQIFNLLRTKNFSEAWNKMINVSWGEKILLTSGFFWPVVSILFAVGIAISLLKFKTARWEIIYIMGIVFYFAGITTLMPELARFRIQAQPFIFMFAVSGVFCLVDLTKAIYLRKV